MGTTLFDIWDSKDKDLEARGNPKNDQSYNLLWIIQIIHRKKTKKKNECQNERDKIYIMFFLTTQVKLKSWRFVWRHSQNK